MKFSMKLQLIIIIALILPISNSALSSSQSKDLVEVNYEWCLKNRIEIDEVLKKGINKYKEIGWI